MIEVFYEFLLNFRCKIIYPVSKRTLKSQRAIQHISGSKIIKMLKKLLKLYKLSSNKLMVKSKIQRNRCKKYKKKLILLIMNSKKLSISYKAFSYMMVGQVIKIIYFFLQREDIIMVLFLIFKPINGGDIMISMYPLKLKRT